MTAVRALLEAAGIVAGAVIVWRLLIGPKIERINRFEAEERWKADVAYHQQMRALERAVNSVFQDQDHRR